MNFILRNMLSTFSNRTRENEQKLMRKGHGWIIHVSDFVKEENGRLVIRDQDGIIQKDAWCITYPGVGGDPW